VDGPSPDINAMLLSRLSNSLSAIDSLVTLCKNPRIEMKHREFILQVTVGVLTAFSCFEIPSLNSAINKSTSKKKSKKRSNGVIEAATTSLMDNISDDKSRVLKCLRCVDMTWLSELKGSDNPNSSGTDKEIYRVLSKLMSHCAVKLHVSLSDTKRDVKDISRYRPSDLSETPVVSPSMSPLYIATSFISFLGFDMKVDFIKPTSISLEGGSTFDLVKESLSVIGELQLIIDSFEPINTFYEGTVPKDRKQHREGNGFDENLLHALCVDTCINIAWL